MSAAPKFKKNDYVALSRYKTLPERYLSMLNCVFKVENYIEDEENYSYVLSIVEGAVNDEVGSMKVVIPEQYLSLLTKAQIEADPHFINFLKAYNLI